MKRRRTGQATSLDLFLDTICNAFGGIMFMAILLSILVQNRSKEPTPVKSNEVQMTASEAREVLGQLSTLTSAHTRLSELLVELRKNQPLPEDQAIRNLIKQNDQMQKELDETIREQAEVSKQLAQQMETNAEIVQSMEEFRAQLTAERSALEKDTLALDEALSDQMEVLKLPVVQTSSKQRVYIFVRHNKVYALTTQPGPVSALSDLNEEDLSIRRIGDNAFNAAPKSARGWSSEGSKVLEYLQACSNSFHVFVVFVWPDSHAEFASLKAKMIQAGFRYELQPIANLPYIPFSPGSTDSRVQ